MEVDKTSFAGRLLEIIEAISTAHFVSFDLELSGIPGKEKAGTKMTLEERYQDVKAAAERYTILQIGLTCAEQDLQEDKYTMRPYNFNLNPLLEERLDIERIWSFQSGAAEFLLSHGFQMDLPMLKGVPYLSRDEASKAKKLAYARWDRSAVEDVQLKEEEVQSLEFVRKVRVAIEQWKLTGKPSPSYLNVVCADPTGDQPLYPELGNFEKRLVHQLIRAEYPDLVSLGKPQAVQIVHFDEDREKSIRESKKRKLKIQIERQIGFRWIIEALCGGELRIDARAFARDVHTGAAKFADIDDLEARFFRARMALKRRRPVLVGHNLFTDIIYLYRTFIGELPPTLEEFRGKIHELFPVIVDTKYMATHNCGDINPRSSLEEIEEKLRSQRLPLILTHGAHRKYHTTEAFHEAGYDSFLTANIMARLSAKLEAAGTYIEETSPALTDDEAYETASDGLTSVEYKTKRAVPSVSLPISASKAPEAEPVLPAQASAPLEDTETAKSTRAERRKQKKREKKNRKAEHAASSNGTSTPSRFSHRTLFDQLADESAEIGHEAEEHSAAQKEPGTEAGDGGWDKPQVEPVEYNGTTYYVAVPAEAGAEQQAEKKEPMTLMPPFDSDFWRVYGNKLRVFGTKESVWKLTG